MSWSFALWSHNIFTVCNNFYVMRLWLVLITPGSALMNANRPHWNINTSIHPRAGSDPGRTAIKCPLVKCWSTQSVRASDWLRVITWPGYWPLIGPDSPCQPRLGPKLPPWSWPWQREKHSQLKDWYRWDSRDKHNTNYNNNTTTGCQPRCSATYFLLTNQRTVPVSRDQPIRSQALVIRDDEIIICIRMTFAWRVTQVSRDSDTRDMWPDISWRGRDITTVIV